MAQAAKGRLAGRTIPLKISNSVAPSERAARIRLVSMLRAGKGIEDDRESGCQGNDEKL